MSSTAASVRDAAGQATTCQPARPTAWPRHCLCICARQAAAAAVHKGVTGKMKRTCSRTDCGQVATFRLQICSSTRGVTSFGCHLLVRQERVTTYESGCETSCFPHPGLHHRACDAQRQGKQQGSWQGGRPVPMPRLHAPLVTPALHIPGICLGCMLRLDTRLANGDAATRGCGECEGNLLAITLKENTCSSGHSRRPHSRLSAGTVAATASATVHRPVQIPSASPTALENTSCSPTMPRSGSMSHRNTACSSCMRRLITIFIMFGRQ